MGVKGIICNYGKVTIQQQNSYCVNGACGTSFEVQKEDIWFAPKNIIVIKRMSDSQMTKRSLITNLGWGFINAHQIHAQPKFNVFYSWIPGALFREVSSYKISTKKKTLCIKHSNIQTWPSKTHAINWVTIICMLSWKYESDCLRKNVTQKSLTWNTSDGTSISWTSK